MVDVAAQCDNYLPRLKDNSIRIVADRVYFPDAAVTLGGMNAFDVRMLLGLGAIVLGQP